LQQYPLSEIAGAVGGQLLGKPLSTPISFISFDTRKIIQPAKTLFFALIGPRNDGHRYLADAYNKGVRHFVVLHVDTLLFPEAGFVVVKDTLMALQQLAAFHRSRFSIPVLGITGSNGKTVVKEWLYQLLQPERDICRSPKSFNSQIGVPLSVWQLAHHHQLGIFEAGISSVDEMLRLENIIQPTIGIITNIGPAHDAGFESRERKLSEKIRLFSHCEWVLYCSDQELVHAALKNRPGAISWGALPGSDFLILKMEPRHNRTKLQLKYDSVMYSFNIPFSDKAYVENCIHCIAIMLKLGYDEATINNRIQQLRILPMRLELKYGLRGCTIIDDSYSADLLSLEVALDFFRQQESRKKRTLIISSFEQSGMNDRQLVEELIRLIRLHRFEKVIGVGDLFIKFAARFIPLKIEFHSFPNTESMLSQMEGLRFDREIILIKGARHFQFERLTYALLGQSHRTVLEIDLNALADNFNVYRNRLQKGVGVIPMVKAFSYGSGSTEIASLLESMSVAYMAVAYVDEGVHLREGGIQSRIMVMNPDMQDFDRMVQHRLEPEIYTPSILRALIYFLETSGFNGLLPIHLKIETGMNRLGFTEESIEDLIFTLLDQEVVKVETIFSHLAASDDPAMDDFSKEQIGRFERISNKIMDALGYPVQRHLLNSSGIARFPEAQYDFVRLGIGLYGIDSAATIQSQLQIIGTLKTRVSQVKEVPAGETVGYNRKGTAPGGKKIAVLAIGYADGYDRRFSNGVGEVVIRGTRASVIGNVCMDMTMVDVSHIPEVKEGDEVEVYGKQISVIEAAVKIGTIPYELLTRISSRVRRVYYWI
jgi:Alr-MurF fusion protein